MPRFFETIIFNAIMGYDSRVLEEGIFHKQTCFDSTSRISSAMHMTDKFAVLLKTGLKIYRFFNKVLPVADPEKCIGRGKFVIFLFH